MNKQAMNGRSIFVIYMPLIAAISLSLSPMTSNSAFAQGTTESDAAAAEETQSTREPLEIISTIQTLLNQAAVEYGNQNFTGAAELAQTAYLDHYEFLEAPLAQLDPALMEATEVMIREDVQNAIESRVPLSELQQLVNTIDGNLIPHNNSSLDGLQHLFFLKFTSIFLVYVPFMPNLYPFLKSISDAHTVPCIFSILILAIEIKKILI